MLAISFIVHSCSQDAVLSKEDAKSLLALRDSIGNDSTDTIPTDTIPHPNDSSWWRITGLDITASSVEDTAIVFLIKSKNYYPVEHARLDLTAYTFPDKWNIGIIRAYQFSPNPGYSQAVRRIVHQRYPNGNWPLNISLRGNTYTGTIHATDTAYSISWAHDSIITIQPKLFPRQ
ncbi:hypothetical protein EG028_27395 [Chitinophaga barathri]|uniref:Uncharacterized protein n=2 Tax=Chitinophaga barathri TaxID=1647451 RepID=A0A3N4M4T4_9BACT|nr:hypothetical protein EG028_27395 [Chitinophaga barathri]